ncbi:MAG: hypothetical protein FGM27_07935 [Candidatus Omnitrophica bacterium]|nr:hypothetical protein [Candidatus Omnitrophota bacterium]
MPRRARNRILQDGCLTHVFSRSLEKRFIFQEHEDFELFKSLILKAKTGRGFSLHHYCLMQTHFHLVASVLNLGEFSSALREIKQGYFDWFRKKYERKGPIWWGRFGSQVIENARYLYACGLYVEMNPVKAKMVSRPEDWPHSSSRYYFKGQPDDLVDNYERPSYDAAIPLTDGLNVGRGSYIGSPLFVLTRQ